MHSRRNTPQVVYLSRIEAFIAFARKVFPQGIQRNRLGELAEEIQPPRSHASPCTLHTTVAII